MRKAGSLAVAVALVGASTIQAQMRPSGQLQDWSAWTPSLVEVPDQAIAGNRWVRDTRLEYRWSPQAGRSCAVEVRPAGDANARYTVSEVDILYESPGVRLAAGTPLGWRRAQVHYQGTLHVEITRQAHASFQLNDCGRVVTTGAGHFAPNVAVPVF